MIIRPRNPNLEYIWGPTAEDHILMVTDWHHDEGNVMAMRLNRWGWGNRSMARQRHGHEA